MAAPSQQILHDMHTASALLQAGKFEQARGLLAGVLRAHPRFVEAHRLLAGAHLALGERARAEQSLRTAAAIDPDWAPVQLALGELLADDGRFDEAESALRRALQRQRHPRAALGLARLLLRRGKAAEAHEMLAPLARPAEANVDLLAEFARTLLALQRNDEAIEVSRRVVAAAPDSALAAARLAGALVAAGKFGEALLESRRAFALGLDQAEAWFIGGSAAAGEDSYDEAEAAFRRACTLQPEYLDAQRELAQLIWMRTGDLSRATALLDATLRERPHAQGLLAIKAALHQGAGDDAGALAMLEPVANRTDAEAGILMTASEAALKTGSPSAIEFAGRARRLLPGDPGATGLLGNALLQAGRAREAGQLALDALRLRENDQGLIALRVTAQRLLGDPAYRETYDYANLVRTWTIDTPDGWPTLPAYLAELAVSLRKLHALQTHPVHQSLRHGTQSTRNLMEVNDPAIRAFFRAIDTPIRRHMQAIGRGADPTRRRNTGRYRIHGIWSVQLHSHGYHTNHVHPEGWLSSACYIDLPAAIERERQGWLKFGEPGVATQPPLAPEHFVRPQPGLLALFPSHMWHGTVPFEGEGTRLTIAFDIVPD